MSGARATTGDRATARAGIALLALGVLHTLATLAGAGATLAAMVADGWWRTADPSAGVAWERVASFWGLWFGLMVILTGWLLLRAGRGEPARSRPWAVALAVVAALGAVAVPAGGFWLVLALGLWYARPRREAAAQEAS